MPVDILKLNKYQTNSNNNIFANNNNMDQKESIPTLNLYQPIKLRALGPTNQQELIKQDINNLEAIKQESNIKETFSSTKEKEFSSNLNNNQNIKKIHLFEFNPKNTNTVEYNLNSILKSNKSNFPPSTSQISSSLFKPPAKNNVVNNTSPCLANNMNNNIQEEQEPFTYSEHPFPSTDEEKISKILNLNYDFQDQNQNIINLIITEIIYISIPKGITIYDLNDVSNFYYIIKKGKVNLIRNKEVTKNVHNLIENNENNNEKIMKDLGPWESFGEISFYNGKKRDEIVITQECVELYLIDSESCRELLKRNNEIILKEKYNFLNNISIFESLDKISKYNVAQKLRKKDFPPNTKIISRGEVGDKLYIIKEGIVSCRIGVKEIKIDGNTCMINYQDESQILKSKISSQNSLCGSFANIDDLTLTISKTTEDFLNNNNSNKKLNNLNNKISTTNNNTNEKSKLEITYLSIFNSDKKSETSSNAKTPIYQMNNSKTKDEKNNNDNSNSKYEKILKDSVIKKLNFDLCD